MLLFSGMLWGGGKKAENFEKTHKHGENVQKSTQTVTGAQDGIGDLRAMR